MVQMPQQWFSTSEYKEIMIGHLCNPYSYFLNLGSELLRSTFICDINRLFVSTLSCKYEILMFSVKHKHP